MDQRFFIKIDTRIMLITLKK